MVRTLWDSITDFIAGGDDRTAALQEGIRENVTPFVPPNLREPLGLLAEMNPVQDMYRAGGNMRAGNYVDAGVDTAIAAAPIVGGVLGRVGANQLADTGGDAARAAMDTLLGGAPAREGADVAARGFLADEAGSVGRGAKTEVLGSGSGQTDLRLTIPGVEGKVDYSVFEGRPKINMIEVPESARRQGNATQLLQALQDQFPETQIDWGSLTEEGSDLFKSTRFFEIPSQYAADFERLDAAKSRFANMQNQFAEMEKRGQRPPEGFFGTWNDLQDEIDSLEMVLEFESPVERIIQTPQSPAQNVATLLREGRADEVTDDMLGALTPNDEMELFDLYQRGATGVDMPMDEASRMARAGQMGFDVGARRFHGGDADIVAVNPDLGAGERYRTGFFSSNNPDVADSYASTRGGRVLPVVARRNDAGASIDVQGGNWSNIGPNAPAKIPNSVLADEFPELADGTTAFDVAPDLYQDLFNEGTTTNALARQRRFEGDSNITFANIVDRGPNIKRYLGETRADQMAREASSSQPSNVRVDFYGNQVRSPFARFDPRLANLRNLSAGIAGAGLLATQQTEQEREDDIRQYLGGLL